MLGIRALGTRAEWGRQLAARSLSALPHGQTLPRESWEKRHRALILLLGLHALALPILSAAHGDGAVHALEHGLAVAAFGVLAYATRHRPRFAASATSAGLITSSALLVHLTGGVIEAHFHFFVMIVVLTLYEDWLAFLIAAGYVVIHHGLAGALAPHAVYNHPDAVAHPWKWALIHGGFVAAAGVASIVNWRLSENARAETLRAHRQTRQILEAAHDPFIAIDERGQIVDCNPQAGATFGWSCEEMLGRELASTIIPERFREAHRHGIERFLATGEARVLGKRIELSALHREGYEFPVELTISPVKTERGEQTFNAFLRDISERKRHERYVEAQHNVQAVLAEAERVSDASPRLLKAICEAMGWEYGAFWGFAGGKLYVDMSWAVPGEDFEAFDRSSKQKALEPGTGLPGRVWESGQPEFVQDVRVDSNFTRRHAARQVGLKVAVAVPIWAQGKKRGVMEFFTRHTRCPEPELLEVMETLTGLIGRFFSIVADREELRGTLERLALTDPLTELPNRRAWNQGLEREISRGERTGESLCVALIDLDGFKQYNDEHGHPAGDDLLRDLATEWGECLRVTDLLARLGGDEFALAFPAHPIETALGVLERLRAVIPHGLTCSAGLARWNSGESTYDVLSRADVALYEAKDRGRDTIVVAEELAAPPTA